jgi:hypothetical protein
MISSQSRQPARTVRIHRSAWALAFGAWTGVTTTSARNTSSNPATELRVAVAEHKAQSLSSHCCGQEQVAGLLGDPGTIGVGRHTGQVDPASGQFDEEQHLQPPQPDGVDREEVAGEDAGRLAGAGTPARSWSSAAGGIEPMATQRGADRGCRDRYAEPEQLALDALVAPARVLPGQADDQLLQLLVQWRRPVPRCG